MRRVIVDLAEDLIPIALTGAGGIGKTFITLAVLHHDLIRERFGSDC
jgi:DNA replication protein DnaC